MQVIVCGAGLVGFSIAIHLAKKGHLVTVIDTDQSVINKINNLHDIRGICGFASYPDVLVEAGARDADAIIAVTASDEVNLVICQIANSLFKIELKIARIRHQNYLKDEWQEIFDVGNFSVDVVISPENEVAKSIINYVGLPGVENIISFIDDKLKVIIFEVKNSNIEAISKKNLSNDQFKACGIMREKEFLAYSSGFNFKAKDKILFIVDNEHLEELSNLLGIKSRKKNIVVIGGGNIGYGICELLEQSNLNYNIKLIELSENRAHKLAEKLTKTLIINGSALDNNILQEVEVESADKIIAVTNDDKINILSSLFAKKSGYTEIITLINDFYGYSELVKNLGIDMVINPKDITIKSITKYFNYENITSMSIFENIELEFVELIVEKNSKAEGKNILIMEDEFKFIIAAIYREDKIIITNNKELTLKADDKIIALVYSDFIMDATNLFSSTI